MGMLLVSRSTLITGIMARSDNGRVSPLYGRDLLPRLDFPRPEGSLSLSLSLSLGACLVPFSPISRLFCRTAPHCRRASFVADNGGGRLFLNASRQSLAPRSEDNYYQIRRFAREHRAVIDER